MRVLCAPDSFKGTLRAVEGAAAMARGLAGLGVEVDLCPIADGGEGTLDAFRAALGEQCELREQSVTGPLGEPVVAKWAILPAADGNRPTGIIEMAQASGLTLVPPDQRDPTRTTSHGTGELIRAAIEAGCGEIIVGIGGSSTCDGGCGAVQALGVKFVREDDVAIDEPMCGHHLTASLQIRANSAREFLHVGSVDQINIRVACDVTNPLCGPNGAAAIYGPQKGATPEQVEELDAGLARLASLCPRVDPDTPGMGAAGGIAFGLIAFLEAKIESGIDCILDAIGFADRLRTADLIITGEGSFDRQSSSGKAVSGIAKAATKVGVPVIVIAGSTSGEISAAELSEMGVRHVISLTNEFGPDRAMTDPATCIEELVQQRAQAWAGF